MLTPQDVQNLAELSRLSLPDEEKAGLLKDMESILGYISELQQVPTGKVEDVYMSSNVMRADERPHEPGLHTGDLLAEMPQREGDYLKVKQILGGSDNA